MSASRWAYANDFDYEWTSDYAKTLKLMLEMASTAVSLRSPERFIKLDLGAGWADLYHRQHDKALAEYARARELNPNCSRANRGNGEFAHIHGRAETSDRAGEGGNSPQSVSRELVLNTWDGPMRRRHA